MEMLAQLEALLFIAGEEGLALEELAHLFNTTTAVIYDQMQQLQNKYQADPLSAFYLLEVGNQFVLSTKKEFADIIKQYAQSPLSNHLSQAALETLAIIAYKQPITRMEIDEIRGVHSAGSVQKLLTRKLIEEKGRVDGPGRAILYGTSQYFMDYFALKSLEELPTISEMEEELGEELPSDLFYDRFKEQLEAADANNEEEQEAAIEGEK